jgi:hypothetical protein
VATLESVYQDVHRLAKLAKEVDEANYVSETDLGDQAASLEEIGTIAKRVVPILRKIDLALGA